MKKSDTYQYYKNSKTANIVVFTLMICVMFLTVGYSAFTATAKIEGVMASVKPTANVRITKLEITGTSDGGISSSQNFNKSKIYGTLELPNATSTVTYKVDMTVFLGAEMKLVDITGLPSNLEYSISSYTFGDTICDGQNNCNFGATDDLYITIGYKSGGYNAGSTGYAYDLDFDFQAVDHVAKVGNTYYESLQAAINSVNTSTQTQVQLLKNRSENISIGATQNIELELNGYTLSNNGNSNTIVNDGTLTLSNGVVTTGVAQGAINNNSGATLTISNGVTISVTGNNVKQAVYNDGGTFIMTGGTLSTTSTIRAAFTNQNSGTATITGGTITATKFNAIDNSSTLTIGTKDGTANQSSPTITGLKYGVNSSTNFNYYDGVIQGASFAISNETKVADTETGTVVVHKGTTISSKRYDAVHLLSGGVLVTFNPDGGTLSNTSILYESGSPLGFLPTPEKTNYVFNDWYDQPSGGNKITTSTTISSPTTLYARWIDISTYAEAQIGSTKYATLEEALNAVPSNTQTTIVILDDIEVNKRISTTSTSKITFDLQGHTIENDPSVTDMPIFENIGGTITIQNGTVRANNSTQGAINNKNTSGNMTINNMTIVATGTRQGVYNERGTMYITGNTTITNSSSERAAVHNLTNAKMYIYGGTFVSNNFSAIANVSATLTFGDDDGSVSTTSPSARGAIYGIDNSGTFNYYDGVFKGISGAIHGNVTNHDANTSVTIGSETIGSDTYETATLQ